MIESSEIVDGDMPSDLDVPVEAESVVPGDLIENPGDIFDLLMIRRDASADEAEGSWQTIEHVDVGNDFFLLEKVVCHVKACRTATDHSNS